MQSTEVTKSGGEPPAKIRRFVHVRTFLDRTQFIEVSDGEVCVVRFDGTRRILSTYSLDSCLRAVARGQWREVAVDINQADYKHAAERITVAEFQKQIATWAEVAFPHQTARSKFIHLRKEIEELGADLSDGEEMADCFILLLNLAEKAGVDLMAKALWKMDINRTRKWGAPDADGVSHHEE